MQVKSPPGSGTGIYKGPVGRRIVREEDQMKVGNGGGSRIEKLGRVWHA